MVKWLNIFLFMLCSVTLCAETEHYRVMWQSDPATTMVVGWNQISGNNATVYYDTVDHGTNPAAYANSHSYDHIVYTKGMTNTFARLTNLQANTAYYFVIADDNSVSNRMWFKTAPNVTSERLSFIAGGDSRNNRIPRQNANKLVAKLRPHAVLFGGDFTMHGTSAQWRDWFEDWQLTIGTDGRIIPIVATRGNHEYQNEDVINIFDVPSTDVFYKLTFGGGLASVYTLNSEISIAGSQTYWLDSELSTDASYFKIAQYHKPVRPHHSSKSEGDTQYSNWVPIFDTYNLDLAIESDSHTAKSTWPVVGSTGTGSEEGFIRDDDEGTVYIGEGCWGAPLRANNDIKSWTRDSGMFNQFKWIFIDEYQIEARTIKTDNADNVGTISDAALFLPPANLDINNPTNGAIISILRKDNQVCTGTCNDNDPCTINDAFDASCNCVGTFEDDDNDGICNVYDVCPGGNDLIDANNNGIPDACDCTVDFTLNDVTGCNGDNIILVGPSGFNSYIWTTGSTNKNIIVTQGGTYGLIVVDVNGCTGTEFMELTMQNCCGNSIVGDACDDGNASTINDVLDVNCNCVGTQATQFTFKVMLEGFMQSYNTMSALMNVQNLIPLNQPFNNNVWNYTGTENIGFIPADMIDWVMVKLYDDAGDVIAKQAALLFKDGTVFSTDFSSQLTFSVDPTDVVKASIHHKSHLAVITATSNAQAGFIDFSAAGNAIGVQQTKNMFGSESLICGDFDNNGIINNLDYNIWASNNSAVGAYLPQDVDGNGIVNNLDVNRWQLNKSKIGEPLVRH